MLCYKDKTFCAAKCLTTDCHRNFTKEVEQGARKWWSHDPDNAPITFSDFSNNCPAYKEVTE